VKGVCVHLNELLAVVGSYVIIPVMMIVFGAVYSKNPPKQINHLSGYRTPMSKKNLDTWHFAHLYFGKLWLKYGVVLLCVTILTSWPVFKVSGYPQGYLVHLFLVAIQMIFVFTPIILTERELRRRFDRNGKPKSKDPSQLP
jgi:uncharacterized membrane protein